MPIYLSLSRAAKDQIDPVRTKRSSILLGEKRPGTPNRAARVFSAVIRRGKKPSSLSTESELATIEHVEGRRSQERPPG